MHDRRLVRCRTAQLPQVTTPSASLLILQRIFPCFELSQYSNLPWTMLSMQCNYCDQHNIFQICFQVKRQMWILQSSAWHIFRCPKCFCQINKTGFLVSYPLVPVFTVTCYFFPLPGNRFQLCQVLFSQQGMFPLRKLSITMNQNIERIIYTDTIRHEMLSFLYKQIMAVIFSSFKHFSFPLPSYLFYKQNSVADQITESKLFQ